MLMVCLISSPLNTGNEKWMVFKYPYARLVGKISMLSMRTFAIFFCSASGNVGYICPNSKSSWMASSLVFLELLAVRILVSMLSMTLSTSRSSSNTLSRESVKESNFISKFLSSGSRASLACSSFFFLASRTFWFFFTVSSFSSNALTSYSRFISARILSTISGVRKHMEIAVETSASISRQLNCLLNVQSIPVRFLDCRHL